MNLHARTLTLSAAALLASTTALHSQPQSEAGQVTRVFHLSAQMNQAEQNETLTAVRNTVPPSLRIILVPSQNEVVVRGMPDQVQIVADLLPQLDHPHKQYRLTYTFTDLDGTKRVGVQRYSMVLSAGKRMQMKEGSRIPLVTGSVGTDPLTKQTTYIDVGQNFDSMVQEYGSGVLLESKIEQSSLAPEKSTIGPDDPIIRQTRLEGTSYLAEGKPLALGTLDVLGTTRKLEVEAVVESVR